MTPVFWSRMPNTTQRKPRASCIVCRMVRSTSLSRKLSPASALVTLAMPFSSASMRALESAATGLAGAAAALRCPAAGATAGAAASGITTVAGLLLPVGTDSACGNRRRALESALRSMPRSVDIDCRCDCALRTAVSNWSLGRFSAREKRSPITAILAAADSAGACISACASSVDACTHQRRRSAAESTLRVGGAPSGRAMARRSESGRPHTFVTPTPSCSYVRPSTSQTARSSTACDHSPRCHAGSTRRRINVASSGK